MTRTWNPQDADGRMIGGPVDADGYAIDMCRGCGGTGCAECGHTGDRLAGIPALLDDIKATDPSVDAEWTDVAPVDADEQYARRAGLIYDLLGRARRLGWPAGIAVDEVDVGGSPELWPIAYVELPTGQVSWHLAPYGGTWDGHTTAQKYARCAALTPDGQR